VIRPSYLVLWDSNLTRSADEILRIIDVCKHENENNENHTVVYIDEEMVGRKRERDEIAKTIQRAMDEDRVEVFYQPIYSVSEQQFVAAEALVRIRSTDGTILPPGVFIPVAEANGSIRMLGEIVFEKTCQFIKNCKLEQYGMHYIEVNLSVEQCESRDLAERYIEIMDRYELNPSWINLEITETGSIKTRKNMLKNMEQLIDYGVCFSLDDFGSGESNLNYIVDMPVEIIKFDRDMTQSFFENEKAQFIMRAARNMIHEMGLKIVAEGVETAEQCSLIEQFGADYIQGYYFSRPLPKDEFVQFLREQGAKQH
jgi:EAL domain-containing protein (putative c-di-GMP-specific phosphodiesterase class I)